MDKNNYSPDKLTVLFFAEPKGYITDLIEKISSEDLNIIIYSRDNKYWNNIVKENNKISLYKDEKEINQYQIDYLLCDLTAKSGIASLAENYKRNFEFAKKFARRKNSKTIFLFNYVTNPKSFEIITQIVKEIRSQNIFYSGCIFLGDIYPLLNFDRGVYFPLKSSEAAALITRIIFSLRAYGTNTAILGSQVVLDRNRYSDFQNYPVDEFITAKEDLSRKVISDYNNSSKKSIEEIKENVTKVPSQPEKKEPPKVFGKLNNKSKFKILIMSFVLLIFLPYLMLFINLIMLNFARNAFLRENFSKSEKIFKSVNLTSKITKNYFYFWYKIPLIKTLNKDFLDIALITQSEANIGSKIISVTEGVVKFIGYVRGEGSFDLNDKSKTISLDLTNLYEELGFLEGEIDSAGIRVKKIFPDKYSGYDINRLKKISFTLSKIFENAPELLGNNNPTKYLLIIQNDAIARPTGGRMEAFAVVTFSGGKIVDWKVYDTAQADKELSGYVEPPKPLEKYFNIKNWYLRDSNWESNFEQSALKAEWFLDKELDLNFKGVVAVNSGVMNVLLGKAGKFEESTDPTGQSGENYPHVNAKNIETDNLQELSDKLFSTNGENVVTLISNLLKVFEQKEVLAYVHNNDISKKISDLGWGGTSENKCFDNCFSDVFLVSEYSDDPLNDSIVREADIKVSLEHGIIKRELKYYMENESDREYDVYLRVYIPSDSGFGQLNIFDEKKRNTVEPDIYGILGKKVAGTYIKVMPKSTVAAVFNWEGKADLDFSKTGEYRLFFNKQPGIDNLTLDLEVKASNKAKPTTNLPVNLTEQGLLKYNNLTSQDFDLRLFW